MNFIGSRDLEHNYHMVLIPWTNHLATVSTVGIGKVHMYELMTYRGSAFQGNIYKPWMGITISLWFNTNLLFFYFTLSLYFLWFHGRTTSSFPNQSINPTMGTKGFGHDPWTLALDCVHNFTTHDIIKQIQNHLLLNSS